MLVFENRFSLRYSCDICYKNHYSKSEAIDCWSSHILEQPIANIKTKRELLEYVMALTKTQIDEPKAYGGITFPCIHIEELDQTTWEVHGMVRLAEDCSKDIENIFKTIKEFKKVKIQNNWTDGRRIYGGPSLDISYPTNFEFTIKKKLIPNLILTQINYPNPLIKIL